MEGEQGEDAAPQDGTRWHQRTGGRLVIAAVIVALALAWNAGTFDHTLVGIGLNRHECARNGFGATFCGKELTEYRERIQGAEKAGKEASAKIEQESSEAEAKAKAQSEQIEAEAQANERRTQEELERDQSATP